jgi:hypothetical protein
MTLQTFAAVSPPPNSSGPKTSSKGGCERTAVPAVGQTGTFVLDGNNLGTATVSPASPLSFALSAVGPTTAPGKKYVASSARFTGIVGGCSVQWTFVSPHVTLTYGSARIPGRVGAAGQGWAASYALTSYDSVTSTATASTP